MACFSRVHFEPYFSLSARFVSSTFTICTPTRSLTDQPISCAFQSGCLSEVIQKTIAIRRGNHYGLGETLPELHMQSIERQRWRTEGIVSRMNFQDVNQWNPLAAESKSHDQVSVVQSVPHGKNKPEVNSDDEQHASEEPRQLGCPSGDHQGDEGPNRRQRRNTKNHSQPPIDLGPVPPHRISSEHYRFHCLERTREHLQESRRRVS